MGMSRFAILPIRRSCEWSVADCGFERVLVGKRGVVVIYPVVGRQMQAGEDHATLDHSKRPERPV